MVENSEGDKSTTSAVLFDSATSITVGQHAVDAGEPEHLERWFKQKMGDSDWVTNPHFDQTYSAADLSAMVVKKVVQDAAHTLGPIKKAVITVPAYFDEIRRKATMDAANQAGLEVLSIINEPTAAALAYGMDKGKGDHTIAVYDLGGGTFDISIIEIDEADGEHTFEVLATNGDTHLGGEDFDNQVINYLVAEFKKDSGMDLRKDPLAMQRLKEAGEKAKIELSSAQQTEVNLPYITADASGPKHLTIKLTRAKLESLVESMVKATLEPLKQALADADLSVGDINDIILVGGQTRMPMVQKYVTEFFGKEPRKDVNADEAVAVGAAIQGGVLSGEHGIGVEKRDLMPEYFSEQDLQQQQRVKCAFDPEGKLNPGKMFPTLHRCAELGRLHVHKGKLPFPDLPRF